MRRWRGYPLPALAVLKVLTSCSQPLAMQAAFTAQLSQPLTRRSHRHAAATDTPQPPIRRSHRHAAAIWRHKKATVDKALLPVVRRRRRTDKLSVTALGALDHVTSRCQRMRTVVVCTQHQAAIMILYRRFCDVMTSPRKNIARQNE